MNQQASVKWTGHGKEGQGWISTPSGVLHNVPYSFGTRFSGEKGTNPEELIAAAHAACFAMALAGALSNKAISLRSLHTTATVSLEKQPESWAIVSSHLSVEADIAGMDARTFQKIAEETKETCPVSRALNAAITLHVSFRDESAQLFT